jgi:hypothetical protein
MRQNIVLFLISLVLMLAVSEAALQWLKPDQPRPPQKPKSDWALVPERIWTEYHPALGWYHEKNKRAVLQKGEIDAAIHTNSQGFRGVREYQIEKPSDVTRILVLGDSFVFGFGVEDDEAFPALLEHRRPDWEVINLGVSGYGIDQILMSYREIGAAYRPDAVVIGIFPEGFWRATRAFADTGHAKPYFTLDQNGRLVLQNVPVPAPFELTTNQFPDLIEPDPLKRFFRRSALFRLLERGLVRLGKNFGWVDPNTTEEWIVGRAILKELVSQIRQDGAVPVLFILPPDRWARSNRKESLLKSIHRFAKQEEVDIIDPIEEFYRRIQDAELTDYYIRDDWHWTPKGHVVAANMLERYFMSS